MHGNVSEWVFDWYGSYDTSNSTDPAGPASGAYRVNRGGAYNDFAKHLRSACRSAINPADADQNTGFRICRNAQAVIQETYATTYSVDIEIPEAPKILIAYYSYSGNDRDAAGVIAGMTGADLFEIEPTISYSDSVYDISSKELDDYMRNGTINPLAAKPGNIDDYDVVILGYPTWWATLPMPVVAFVTENDLSGKTVVTFSSNGGTHFGDSVSDLAKLLPNSRLGLPYQFYYGGYDRDEISSWLSENDLIKK